MPLRANNSNRNYEKRETPFEEKGYLARIVQIVDLGKQEQGEWRGDKKDPKYEVMVTFEFPEVRNQEDKPAWLSKFYQFPYSWPEKSGLKDVSNLYKLFNMFAPSYLTQSTKFPEYYFFDDNVWSKLLNTPVFVEVALTNSGNAKVKSVNKVPEIAGQTIEVPELENETLLFEASVASVEDWSNLYQWVRRKILRALDEETVDYAVALEKQLPEQVAVQEEKPTTKPKGKKKKEEVVEDFDDDIPF